MAGYVKFVVNEGGTERTFRLPLSKVDATVSPGVSNDNTEGYEEGSLWVNVTDDEVWTCVDNSTGAAVWVQCGGGGGAVTSNDVTIDVGPGSPAADTLQDYIQNTGSAGYYSGGSVSASATAGAIDVTTVTGCIRTSSSSTAPIVIFELSGTTALAVPSNTIRYLYVDYNAGSPQWVLSSSYQSESPAYVLVGGAVNEGGAIATFWNEGVQLNESIAQAGKFLRHVIGLTRDIRVGGLKFANTGTRNLTLSAGVLWRGRTEYTITAKDTTVFDSFTQYYRNGAGGWTKEVTQTQWENTKYDDGSGTLATLTGSKYACRWLYIIANDTFIILYGQAEHANVAAAEAESPPTSPDIVTGNGVLAARLIFQKSASTPTSISSAFDTKFSTTGGGGGTVWGDITGTLADQTDLQSELDGKQDADADLTAIAALTRAQGALIVGGSTDWGLLSPGSDGQVLTRDSMELLGVKWAAGSYQPLDTDLTEIAGLTRTKGALIVGESLNWGLLSPDSDGKVLTLDSLELTGTKWVTPAAGVSDHGALTGLSDDDHTQYALLAGRSSGQTLKGGTGSGDGLTLESTSHATKGVVQIADGSFLQIKSTASVPSSPAPDNHKLFYHTSTDRLKIISYDGGTGLITSLTYGTQSANKVLASPSSGSPALPDFRALVADDLPTVTVAKGGTGVSALQNFSGYRNTNYSIPVASWNKLPIDTERWDVGSKYDNATNYRFTPTVAGTYLVSGHFYSTDPVSNNLYAIAIYKNGALAVLGSIRQITATRSYEAFIAFGMVQLNGSTDYIELYGYNGHASATLTLIGGVNNNQFAGSWLAPSS